MQINRTGHVQQYITSPVSIYNRPENNKLAEYNKRIKVIIKNADESWDLRVNNAKKQSSMNSGTLLKIF